MRVSLYGFLKVFDCPLQRFLVSLVPIVSALQVERIGADVFGRFLLNMLSFLV